MNDHRIFDRTPTTASMDRWLVREMDHVDCSILGLIADILEASINPLNTDVDIVGTLCAITYQVNERVRVVKEYCRSLRHDAAYD